jgi:hypothetical protein
MSFRSKDIDYQSVSTFFWTPLYLIYTSDLPTSDNTTATFTDDTAILATHEDPAIASMKLKASNNKGAWEKKWRIKINQSKSTLRN